MSTKSFRYEFEAIGTHWVIDVFDAPPDISQAAVSTDIQRRINAFDSRYSRFRAGTMIDRMSKTAGAYIIEPHERPLVELYYELYKITGGLFTPLIGQALADAGYDIEYSLKSKKHISPVENWDSVLKYSGGTLEVLKPTLLDFGAAGKGFIVDEISLILKNSGIKSFCVDAGGDMYFLNENNNPIEVGLEHPDNPKQVIGTVPLLNEAICGSAGNRRAWGRFHHIINPRTLISPNHIKSVWVIAASAMLADALATCLYFVSPQTLSNYAFQYLILHNDYTIEKSEQFPAKLYYNES